MSSSNMALPYMPSKQHVRMLVRFPLVAHNLSLGSSGGPLELGDIEDIEGSLCVSCPWHHFSFCLTKGASVKPEVNLVLNCVDTNSRSGAGLQLKSVPNAS